MPRITDFCICIYVFGCRLSLVRLCDSDLGITPVDDITIGITCSGLLLLLLLLLFTRWKLIDADFINRYLKINEKRVNLMTE